MDEETLSEIGYDHVDAERWSPEHGKSPRRTPFERDRARVVHSAALRRLGAKTQVLTPIGDDFVRNRLTHSLEVAQVGRELGKSLGCDPDVVDAACLSHDLGHPPFGHNGERALADLCAGIGGFEGNAQTLRLLTRLEAKRFDAERGRSAGLNLTRASLDAATKYPWFPGQGPDPASKKYGVYPEDKEIFEWIRAGTEPLRRCLEAQVMDLADDISYSVHDVEDAVVGSRLDLAVLRDSQQRDRIVAQTRAWYRPPCSDQDLEDALERLPRLPYWVRSFDGSRASLAELKEMTSQLIGRFCAATEDATRERFGPGPLTRYRADLVVCGTTIAEISVLKGMAALYVMAPREDEPLFRSQRLILSDLVDVLSRRAPLGLEPPFADDWLQAGDDDGRLRVIVDQVASLTDSSAVDWHARLCP